MPSARFNRPATSPLGQSRSVAWILLLTAITFAGAGMRCLQVGESLWLDELHTAWTVSDTVGQVASRAALGNQAPAYFYVVWLCVRLLGLTELAVRTPSLVAGIALVPAVGLAALKWTNSRPAAICAAGLAAVDHDFLFFSQEARPYAAVQLVGLLHIFVFWERYRPRDQSHSPRDPVKMEGDNRLGRVWFIGSAVALFYLHYTSAGLLLAEVVCFAIWHAGRAEGKRATMSFVLDLLGIAALAAPAAPHLVRIAARRADWALFVPPADRLDLLRLFPLDVYVALPLGLLTLSWWVTRHKPRPVRLMPEPSTLAVLLACWLVVPLLGAWSLTSLDVARLFLRRYLIASAVAPVGLASLAVAVCRPGWFQRSMLLVILSAAIWKAGLFGQLGRDGRFVGDRTQDWRAAAHHIQAAPGNDRLPVLVRSGLIESDALAGSTDPQLRSYCLLPVTGIYRIEGHELIPLPNHTATELPPEVLRLIRSQGGCWLLLNAQHSAVEQILEAVVTQLRRATRSETPRVVLQMREPTVTRNSFGDLVVIRIDLEPEQTN